MRLFLLLVVYHVFFSPTTAAYLGYMNVYEERKNIYHCILNVMFENALQIIRGTCITMQTQIPPINYKPSSFQKKFYFDVIRNDLRNTQMFNGVFLITKS